ncbi:MAG: hypothetical protein D6775_02900 [Caldilineae bacterium]|nr:MAG: hypothetical protein D6775_02900 [Caldilineae bacterium]
MNDLSGPLALFGNEAWEGFQIGLDYATDGTREVNGRPLEVVMRDDASDVEAGASAARELIEAEGVDILAGVTSSALALQVQQIADENEIVYLAGPAASMDITGKNWNPHTFRVCRNSAQDAAVMAGWAIENIGKKYIIFAEDYAFGQATAAAYQAAITAMGGEFLTEEPIFAPSDTTDFTPYVQQILELQPDGIVLIWASNTTGQILLEQFEAQGIAGNIPYVTGFFSNDVVRTMNPGVIGSIGYIVYHYTLPNTPANDFLTEQYKERFGGPPDLFSECGFATAQAIVEGLKKTGGDPGDTALIPALEGLSFEGVRGDVHHPRRGPSGAGSTVHRGTGQRR